MNYQLHVLALKQLWSNHNQSILNQFMKNVNKKPKDYWKIYPEQTRENHQKEVVRKKNQIRLVFLLNKFYTRRWCTIGRKDCVNKLRRSMEMIYRENGISVMSKWLVDKTITIICVDWISLCTSRQKPYKKQKKNYS